MPKGKVRRKKVHRKKKRIAKNHTSIIVFPKGQRTLPDRLHVTLFTSLYFTSAAAVGTAGSPATFNVNGMYLTNPWISSGLGPTFIPYTAAVGGAGGGFAGTLITGNTATAPGFFAKLMELYRFYFTKKSRITVKVDVDNSADEGTICIRPGNNVDLNTTVFDNAAESRYSKTMKIGSNTTGMRGANQISNSIKTSTILGYPISDDILTLEAGFIGTLGAGPANPWSWQIMYQNTFSRATGSPMSFEVKVSYDVIFIQPQPYNT